jgi:serine/threonine protein kinase
LTDFGISEVGFNQNKYAISNYNIDDDELEVKSKAILGTEHYLAPEIIKGEDITSQIDYWSLGVLIYELYTNKVPFMAENFTKIADNIINLNINWLPFDNLINEPDYSEEQLKNAKSLIMKFLDLDPCSRWGYNNIDKVKKHEFFTNFDWKNIKNITDPVVKKYVLEQIKEVNKRPAGKEPSLNVSQRMDTTHDLNDTLKINQSMNDPNATVEYEDKNFMNTQRVDNLFAKCQEVIKNNIKQKTLNIDTGDDKFTDLLNDILG